jgi:hypothetical protein
LWSFTVNASLCAAILATERYGERNIGMVPLNWTDILEKILLPVGGYFARVLQTFGNKRRMRRQLYREISRNYHKLDLQIHNSTSVSGLLSAAPLHFADRTDISFDVWNFYNDEKRRESFFQLGEADSIARIYDKLNLIALETSGYSHVKAKEALAEIEDRLLDGTLDRNLFEKVSDPQTRPFVQDLFSGKRERYRKFLRPLGL